MSATDTDPARPEIRHRAMSSSERNLELSRRAAEDEAESRRRGVDARVAQAVLDGIDVEKVVQRLRSVARRRGAEP